MGILVELLIPPAPPRIKKTFKICPERPSGARIDDLERRNGSNPSNRCIGKPISARTATEDKCGSSWAYLLSYSYHQPLLERQVAAQSTITRLSQKFNALILNIKACIWPALAQCLQLPPLTTYTIVHMISPNFFSIFISSSSSHHSRRFPPTPSRKPPAG